MTVQNLLSCVESLLPSISSVAEAEIVAALIKRKARQLSHKPGFSLSDQEDLEQELLLKLCKRRSAYNPTRGTWLAFAKTLVERDASNLARNRCAAKRGAGRIASLHVPVGADEDGLFERSQIVTEHQNYAARGIARRDQQESAQLQFDVASAIEKLPPQLRELAMDLREKSPSEIARERKIPRTTLYGAMSQLCRRFRLAGLKDYL